jgi:prevent-host-death family protein
MLSDDQEIRAVTITELDQRVSAVIEEVAAGRRVIVTKHGLPVAVIVSIAEGFDALIAASESFALLRREAREELDAGLAAALPDWRTQRE